jgi:hypothetical protein
MEKDKLMHFVAGLGVALVVGAALHPALGQAAAAFVGCWKEDRDAADPANHTYDGWDAYWTATGGVPALALLALVQAAGWWVPPLLR